MSTNEVDGQYYEVATPSSLSEKLMAFARDRIYADFLRLCAPNASDTILDVGVSDVVGNGANVIERRYPAREKITAVGLGQGNAFKVSFPQIQYRQIVANQALPFADASFDCHRECGSRARRQRRKPAFLHLRIDARRRTGFYHRATSIFPCGASHRDSFPSLVRRHVPCRVPRLGRGEMGRLPKT